MKIYLLSLIILLSGCATSRVQLKPQITEDQSISYDRGHAKLASQSKLNPILSVLEYSENEMIVSLEVLNNTQQTIAISEKNLSAQLITGEQRSMASVYSYEQVLGQAADKGYKTAVKVGSTAARIGANFVPFGGIAYSVGGLLYSIGEDQNQSHQERVDKLLYSKINQHYLRQQSIKPGKKYAGLLKVVFNESLKAGDKIVFTLGQGGQEEKFSYSCQKALAG